MSLQQVGSVETGQLSGLVRGEMAGDAWLSLVAATTVTGATALLTPASVLDRGCATPPFAFDGSVAGGVVADSPSSSGIGAQYVFKTCLSAGRRMGFDRKKSMPESKHSWTMVMLGGNKGYYDTYLYVGFFSIRSKSDNGSRKARLTDKSRRL